MANTPIIDNSVYISSRDRKIKALAKMVRQKKDLRTIYNGAEPPPELADQSIDEVIIILEFDLRQNQLWILNEKKRYKQP